MGLTDGSLTIRRDEIVDLPDLVSDIPELAGHCRVSAARKPRAVVASIAPGGAPQLPVTAASQYSVRDAPLGPVDQTGKRAMSNLGELPPVP